MRNLLLVTVLAGCGQLPDKDQGDKPPLVSSTPPAVGQCWREQEAAGLSFEFWPVVRVREVGEHLVVLDRLASAPERWITPYSLTHEWLRTHYDQQVCP